MRQMRIVFERSNVERRYAIPVCIIDYRRCISVRGQHLNQSKLSRTTGLPLNEVIQ